MFSRFFRKIKRDPTDLPLGRWNTIVREKEISSDLVSKAIERNAYWGNHDHCGSEICKTPISNLKKQQKEQTLQTLQTEQTQQKVNEKNIMKMMEDPFWPYIL